MLSPLKTITRSEQEIIDRVKITASNGNDFFGVTCGNLLGFVSYEKARSFYKDDLTKEQIEKIKAEQKSPTIENIHSMMKGYLPFAWDKANGCRGISANRSIDHMRAYLWLLSDEILEEMESIKYEHYGKEKLIYCSEVCGFNWARADNGERTNNG